jgi:hypothetical protein
MSDKPPPLQGLRSGMTYIIHYRSWHTRGWREYEMIAQVLDFNEENKSYILNLRPVAGTATLYDADIISATQARDKNLRVAPHRTPNGLHGRYRPGVRVDES